MSIIDKLKRTLINNKVLFKNFSSLTILQISQYVFPLITFPYITRVLGPETFGLVSFILVFNAYFTAIVEFGFNLSGTQKIAIHKYDKEKYSKIFWEVIYSKIILFGLCSVFFLIVVLVFESFFLLKSAYVIAYLSVLGTVFFPQWFFMGKEDMHLILLINFPYKLIYSISIFIFITSQSDWKILILLNSFTMILIGVSGFIIAIKRFNISYNSFSFNDIKQTLFESSQIFLSLFSISVYSSNNIFLLGLFANTKILGLYVVADKIRLFMQIIPHAFSESFFPHISSLFQKSNKVAFKRIKNYSIISVLAFLISIVCYLTSDLIIEILVGSEYADGGPLLRILAWVPFIVALRDTLGKQIMLNIGMKNEFTRVFVVALIFSLICSVIVVPYFFALGTSIILLATEVFVLVSMFRKVKKYFS